MRTDGGYDAGYSASGCFWGRNPGTMIARMLNLVPDLADKRVLDIGCGEGKNSVFLAERGAHVDASDISELAIANARKAWPSSSRVSFTVADAQTLAYAHESFDIVIAYGLLHCLRSRHDVLELILRMQSWTQPKGLCIVCVFNDRAQEFSAHPDLEPCLLPHQFYEEAFSSWTLEVCTDQDLTEQHPPELITHTHSLTRLVARKP